MDSSTESPAPIALTNTSTTQTAIRLSIMMFLQYALWGVWSPYLAAYLIAPIDQGGLGFTGGQTGWIISIAGSIGAVSAPILGQIADRYMNAERAMAILLLVAGISRYACAYATGYYPFLWLSIVFSVMFMPTVPLTNSISFHHLADPVKDFSKVRAWGSIGWILASGMFPIIWLATPDEAVNTARIADALKVSGVIAVLHALYCLTLVPKTPPQPRQKDAHPFAFAKSLSMLRHRGVLVAVVLAVPISITHRAFMIRNSPFFKEEIEVPTKWIGQILSVAQWAEIAYMLMLGFLIKRIGFKGTFALGAVGHLLPTFVYAAHAPLPVIIATQAVHSMAFGFYFMGAFLYIDRMATKDIRHSAQTMFSIVVGGIGPILSGFYNEFFDRFTKADGSQDYSTFWWVQSGISLVVLVGILTLFPNRENSKPLDHGGPT